MAVRCFETIPWSSCSIRSSFVCCLGTWEPLVHWEDRSERASLWRRDVKADDPAYGLSVSVGLGATLPPPRAGEQSAGEQRRAAGGQDEEVEVEVDRHCGRGRHTDEDLGESPRLAEWRPELHVGLRDRRPRRTAERRVPRPRIESLRCASSVRPARGVAAARESPVLRRVHWAWLPAAIFFVAVGSIRFGWWVALSFAAGLGLAA